MKSRNGLKPRVNVADFKEEAKSILSDDSWNYLDGAAESESSNRINESAYRSLKIIPKVLSKNVVRDQSIELFGHRYNMPVGLAPTSPLKLFHDDAELAQVGAAKNTGTLAVYSTDSHYDLETVGAASNRDCWFQLYAYGSEQVVIEMLAKAKQAGFKAIVVTADAFYAARRERMLKSNFVMPDHVKMGNLAELQNNPKYRRADGSVKRIVLGWDDLKWIKETTNLPVVIKGIMHPSDAVKSLEYGAQGIVVSNHGGRQLDDTPATIDCLKRISEVTGDGGEFELMVDGGIYRGIDVLKAIACGAKAVLIGRAYIYALAARGQFGIEEALGMFREEIDNAMAQLGVSTLDELNQEFIRN